jgi:diguanylate cyclase (GGDEF)-like protein
MRIDMSMPEPGPKKATATQAGLHVSAGTSSFALRFAQAAEAMAQGRYANCTALAESLYADALALGDTLMTADAALLLSKSHSNNQDGKSAMRWAQLGFDAAQACQAKSLQAVACVVMASTHAQAERPVQSVEAIQKALSLLDDGMTPDVQRTVFTGIGLSYTAMGMPLQALVALKNASAAVQSGGTASQKARARVNVLFALVASHDLLIHIDAPRAVLLLEDAQRECELLQADAQLAGNAHAHGAYCHGAGMVHFRAGRLAQALASFNEVLNSDQTMPAHLRRMVLIRQGRVFKALGDNTNAGRCAQESMGLWPAHGEQPQHADDLLSASELAELLGDGARALALYKRYHARVVRNEQAAFDARLADLSATLAAQSMRLEISDLQARNAGLSETFKSLNDMALTDALTGVANRRGLEQKFDVLRARGQNVVLVMLDLDHFKQINDQFSHGVGDQVLHRAAQLMGAALRERDQLARYGGEEFTALLAGTDLPEAFAAAERMRKSVWAFDWPSLAPGLRVTLSAGMVAVAEGEAFAQAAARADVLLYRAKSQGRNLVVMDDTKVVDHAASKAI